MPSAAYIHIPFCSHKCDFCDFAAFAGVDHLFSEYAEVVVKEIAERTENQSERGPLNSLFYGGGTPGYIDIQYLEQIQNAVNLYIGLDPDAEVSLETTPQAISLEKARSWLAMGINRLSIGLESMHDSELKAMGRDHLASQGVEAFDLARQAGFANIAVDLMFGLPEQSLDSFADSLRQVIALNPDHVSAYGLTIANNSPLLNRYPLSCPAYPQESEFAQMYELLVATMEANGYWQYEISNFARTGFQSRHNICYWRCQEYYGFGVSAHRYVAGQRSSNYRSLKRYMREYKANETEETIDSLTAAKDYLMLGLRLLDGVDLKEYEKLFGRSLDTTCGAEIKKLEEGGFLERQDDRLRLTRKALLVSNLVLSELI